MSGRGFLRCDSGLGRRRISDYGRASPEGDVVRGRSEPSFASWPLEKASNSQGQTPVTHAFTGYRAFDLQRRSVAVRLERAGFHIDEAIKPDLGRVLPGVRPLRDPAGLAGRTAARAAQSRGAEDRGCSRPGEDALCPARQVDESSNGVSVRMAVLQPIRESVREGARREAREVPARRSRRRPQAAGPRDRVQPDRARFGALDGDGCRRRRFCGATCATSA